MKSKPKPKSEVTQKSHKFTLEDFRGGAIAGVLCLAAFRDPSLLEPVRKWIEEGKLVFAPGETDIVCDVLYLAESMPKIQERARPEIKRPRHVDPKPPPQVFERPPWPFICGRMAKEQGQPRTYHSLTENWERDAGKLVIGSESHKQWLAGFDSAKVK